MCELRGGLHCSDARSPVQRLFHHNDEILHAKNNQGLLRTQVFKCFSDNTQIPLCSEIMI